MLKYFKVYIKWKTYIFFLLVYCFMMDSSKSSDYCEYFGKIHGILMYKDFIKHWDDVETFQARPDDIVIATYPKSGKSP